MTDHLCSTHFPPLVFFIVGGPGSGKGTNCTRFATEFGFEHISAGELLRVEATKDTPRGRHVSSILSSGHIVPSEITMELMQLAVVGTKQSQTSPSPAGFLIDGFPRKRDQGEMFEQRIGPARKVIHLRCSEGEMLRRLRERQGARRDDSPEVILERLRTNTLQCVPVLEQYRREGRVDVVDCDTGSVEEVYQRFRKCVLQHAKL